MAETTTIDKLILGDVVSFNIVGVMTLNNVRDGILLGFESGNALRDPATAAANHANIYSAIPVSLTNPVPNDYTKYNYLLLKLVDNTVIEVGIPWINPVSISRLVRKTATVTITDWDVNQEQALTDLLTTNGYLNFIITVN